MQRNLTPEQLQFLIVQACKVLEVPLVYLKALSQQAPTVEAKEKQIQEFKEVVKANWKRLAKLHHPDKPTGSEEKFKALQGAYELLGKLDIQVAQRRPVQPIRTWFYSYGYTTGGSTTSSTSTTYW